MSTRSYINVKIREDRELKLADGSTLNVKANDYIGVYCHSDGYPSHMHVQLMTHFNSYEDALRLVSNGNLSCVNSDGSVESYYSRGEDLSIYHGQSPRRAEYTYTFEQPYLPNNSSWTWNII